MAQPVSDRATGSSGEEVLCGRTEVDGLSPPVVVSVAGGSVVPQKTEDVSQLAGFAELSPGGCVTLWTEGALCGREDVKTG